MRTTTAVVLLTATLALTSCSSGGSGNHTKTDSKPSHSAAPAKLEPVWGPKLEAAAGKDTEAVSACNQPSSNACARYVDDIMDVATGLKAAIGKTGREYPASLEQIGKMQAAQSEYKANGCQGDITAEDPNSQCHGVVTITIGATTLDITLQTDEVGI